MSDAKLKEELTLGSKNDTRNLVNFHPTTQKSKNFTLMGYFCPNYMRFELKKYRGVIFYDIEVMQSGMLIASAKILQRKYSISPPRFYG